MAINQDKVREYTARIMRARMALMSRNGFFGILLMHMKFALDESVRTAATDGEKLYIAPSFLEKISDRELLFILQHEILHVVLRHCLRTGDRNNYLFNVACDIVVNSTILDSAGGDISSITLSKYGESMHIAPNGEEGCKYTAEKVYDMLNTTRGIDNLLDSGEIALTDDHSKWGSSSAQGLDEEWMMRVRNAYEAARKRQGKLPAGLERQLGKLFTPVTDWRTILNAFVQEEVTDYSFTPPDRRFDDSPFFLPDFNEKADIVRNILFMIDTSGSMSEEEVTKAYSEVKGAIDQFDGRLAGWLGFFDAEVIEPVPFEDESEFSMIRPSGGGGTSFDTVFAYIQEKMADMDIASIIILTDGYAPFPKESEAMGIPVLWMINNDDITPPWGKTARI